MLTLDGSLGEGGGQILRSALGLSLVTGTPFTIDKIRARRQKPGLMRQHLAAVRAAAEICGGEAVGSSRLTFQPGRVRAGEYHFATGSAGSTTLVLQTILPGLMRADGPSTVTLEGGTHNPHAPPLDFLEKAFLPILARIGPKVTIVPERSGFYPAGGGRFVATIEPASAPSPVHLDAAVTGQTHRLCTAVVAGLPGQIALRELEVAKRVLGWPDSCFQVRNLPDDQGPGNVVLIEVGDEQVTEVFTSFGSRGVRAEAVAEAAAQEVKAYLAAGVSVGPHLADQLLLPLSLGRGGSFVTQPLTPHATTNIQTIRAFIDVRVTADEIGPGRWRVDVETGNGGSQDG